MGLEEAPSPQSALSAFSPPGPFSGEKRNYLGARGFQRSPRGQRCSGSAAPCLAKIWTPEKYWRPWLAELFFRFEPAPPFDSDPLSKESAFRNPRRSPLAQCARGEGGRAAPRRAAGPLGQRSPPRNPGSDPRGGAPPRTPQSPRPGGAAPRAGAAGALASRSRRGSCPASVRTRARAWLERESCPSLPQSTCLRHQNRKRKMLGKNSLFPSKHRNHRSGKSQSCGTSLH